MRIGAFEVFFASDGTFRLDGGAMFGIVPKTLWSRLTRPDRKNRIRMGLNSLVVRFPGGVAVVDTGMGGDWDATARKRYGMSGCGLLPGRLRGMGVPPESVTHLVCTHLHFDHAGGNCTDGRPTFPEARYLVQRAELDAAANPGPLSAGSYREGDWRPVETSGNLVALREDRVELAPGMELLRTGGHTRGHQMVTVSADGLTVACPGDLVPTRHHLNLPYIMGYDLYPEELVARKRELLERAAADGWLLLFEHDAEPAFCRVERHGRRFFAKPLEAAE